MSKKTIRNVSILGVFCVLLLLLIVLMDVNSYRPAAFNGNTGYSGNAWFFGEKGGVAKPARLSESYDFEPGKTYVLSTVLNYNGEQDSYPCAFITTGNFEVETYLDHQLVAHYTKEDRGYRTVQSVGTCSFSVPLGNNCKNRELSIELRSPFTSYTTSRNLPVICIGDYSTILRNLFHKNLPNMIISCAILFNVIVLVLLSNLRDKKQWSYVYFSIFSIFVVIFRITQNLFDIYMLGNPYAIVFWEHMAVAASPIPLLLSYRYKFSPLCEKAFNWMIILSVANIGLQLTLHNLGIVDLVPMMQVTHILLIIFSIGLYFIGVYVKRKTGVKHLFTTIIPIIAGAFMDITSFYIHHLFHGKGGFFSLGNYVGIGLLISLILMIIETRNERINSYKKIEKSRLLEKMAYCDALTGLNNRASFDMELNMIHSHTIDPSSILCVSADINGLKTVNDSIGHHAGDQLICRTAGLLNKCFSRYGKVFRIGGDEFFAFLYDVNEEQWKQIKEDLTKELELDNANYGVPLSIAIGSTFLGSENIYKAIQYADHFMYQDKQQYHNQHHDNKKYTAMYS